MATTNDKINAYGEKTWPDFKELRERGASSAAWEGDPAEDMHTYKGRLWRKGDEHIFSSPEQVDRLDELMRLALEEVRRQDD